MKILKKITERILNLNEDLDLLFWVIRGFVLVKLEFITIYLIIYTSNQCNQCAATKLSWDVG